jgi:hypothetical protein
MTNIWKKGPLTINPYYETAFRVLGITRDVTSRAEIGQRIEERRQAVAMMPGFYNVGERPLTGSDITAAGQILSDPTRRILEELLEHRPESLPVDEVERVRARLAMPDWPDGPLPLRHLAFLLRVVQEMAQDYLENLPPVEVPPFPIDIRSIPPFGLLEEEDRDD